MSRWIEVYLTEEDNTVLINLDSINYMKISENTMDNDYCVQLKIGDEDYFIGCTSELDAQMTYAKIKKYLTWNKSNVSELEEFLKDREIQ